MSDRLRLSVVVISYNMAREIPRTIRSLSPPFQKDIDPGDYEILLVDNGSKKPFDEAECRRWAPNLAVHRMQDPVPTPVLAVNHGLAAARGELVCVMIDGARMASPRLLSRALQASRLHERPVIGALAFHLGSEAQNTSVRKGYNQQVEDELLRGSGWEEDGYNLFTISAPDPSSDKGWFTLPAESNSLFLRKEHWEELGGFDERFVSVGGGLVNLDIWARACADPRAQTILLLGEGTFHQFHGGVATNAVVDPWEAFDEEYARIRGHKFRRPEGAPWTFGTLPLQAVPTLAPSALGRLPKPRKPLLHRILPRRLRKLIS